MATNGRIDDEGIKLLKEARKILVASGTTRVPHKDYIQRINDYLRKREKEKS